MSEALMKTLITDRSMADVLHWRELRDKGYANMTEAERAEWDLAQMKGAYNPAWDMNRVGAALNYLRDRLIATNYLPPAIFTAKTNWTAQDVPTATALRTYLKQVEIIRAAMSRYASTPKTPAYSGGLDHIEANNIEQILLDIDQLITNMLTARYFSGELFCGEV